VTSDNLGNNWSYDAEGRVSTVAGYTYTYDGDGSRVIKSGTNSRMYWTDPGGTVLSETDLSGNNTVRDVYLGNKLIARKDASGSIHYLVQDQLGSERVSVSASGAVEDDMDTYPWGGDATTSTATSGNLYTFTGDEKDTESTSFHTPFRQLSSTMGRWLRPDPYDGSYDPTNPQSLNRYSYVLNNPLSFIDPSGLDGCVMGQGGIGTKGCATVCANGCHDQYGNSYTLDPNGVPVLTGLLTTITVTAQPDPNHPQAPCLTGYCLTAGPVNPNSGQSSAPNPGGAGTSAPAPNSDPCYNKALASVGVGPSQLRQRIRNANLASNLFGLLGYASLVRPGGQQDDKNLPQNRSVFGPLSNAVAAGNISFGVTCPFGAGFCQFAAGAAQTIALHPDFSGPLGAAIKRGFDTPSDNLQIQQGQAIRAAGCHT
jgi:RHS repeat-associated protein